MYESGAEAKTKKKRKKAGWKREDRENEGVRVAEEH